MLGAPRLARVPQVLGVVARRPRVDRRVAARRMREQAPYVLCPNAPCSPPRDPREVTLRFRPPGNRKAKGAFRFLHVPSSSQNWGTYLLVPGSKATYPPVPRIGVRTFWFLDPQGYVPSGSQIWPYVPSGSWIQAYVPSGSKFGFPLLLSGLEFLVWYPLSVFTPVQAVVSGSNVNLGFEYLQTHHAYYAFVLCMHSIHITSHHITCTSHHITSACTCTVCHKGFALSWLPN